MLRSECVEGSASADSSLDRAIAPSARVVTIGDLIAAAGVEKFAQSQRAAQTLSLDSLDALYRRVCAEHPRKRLGRYVLECEYTRRGVPPCLRRGPPLDGDSLESVFDEFLADAEWLVSRYPKQRTRWPAFQPLFSERSFHTKARYIFFDGRRECWQIINGLQLDACQMMQCRWLRKGQAREQWNRINEQLEDICSRLRGAHLTRALKRRDFVMSRAEKTIRRRVDVWLCWKVARHGFADAARFYEAWRGERLSRQRLAAIVDEVKSDLAYKREDL